jgi:hypothetical protein
MADNALIQIWPEIIRLPRVVRQPVGTSGIDDLFPGD